MMRLQNQAGVIVKRTTVLVVAAILLVLSGCSRSNHQAVTNLAPLLVPAPPNANATGHHPRDISLAEAAKLWAPGDSGAEKTLRDLGYQEGATEQWIESDDTLVSVLALQFDNVTTPIGACVSFDGYRRRNPVFTAGADIPGTSHGRVYLRAVVDDRQRWISDAVFAKGKAVVYLSLGGPVWFGTERLVQLAQAQYDRLP